MANVLHKSTLQFRRSVNTPDFQDGNWIINPDPTIVATVPQKYWKVVGESLLEMDAGEKAAVDAIVLAAAKIAKKTEINTTVQSVLETNFPPEKQRTLFNLIQEAKADGLTNRLAYLAPLWTWIKQGIALVHNKEDAIDSAVDISEVNAVSLNLDAINASVPNVTIRGALAIVD